MPAGDDGEAPWHTNGRLAPQESDRGQTAGCDARAAWRDAEAGGWLAGTVRLRQAPGDRPGAEVALKKSEQAPGGTRGTAPKGVNALPSPRSEQAGRGSPRPVVAPPTKER
ncbi:hypothetical protein NDU88_004419 [Pleurodeles waltl]|uniref:Uncharacterized protein n=1 Tax=Pleurodeles waltl TaxID=8319 RepID=A0AAV7UF89_PLEWA|nr:hypothetical protein NDU88_004419 [Pleurodeles waltl]